MAHGVYTKSPVLTASKVKVKFSRTRYRALGLELIPQVILSHPPGSRLPLLSAKPAVTFPVEERHLPSAGTKLYCLVTEAHACEQLAQDCHLEADRPRFVPATFWIASKRSTVTHATQATASHRLPNDEQILTTSSTL